MAAAINLMVGNTSPAVSDVISFVDASDPDGSPVNLTGATVKLQMRLVTSSTLKVDSAASVTSAVNGAVSYQWVAGNVDTAGTYAAWFRVTFAGGSIQDTPEFIVRINAHAPITGGYTTVAAVRDYLSKDLNDSAQDDLIADLITRYSSAVDDFCQVSFASASSSTKRFRFYGRTVSFSKYGLNSASAVVLSPEDSALTLVANTDYILLPLNKENGCYTSMELSSWLVSSPSTFWRLGMTLIDVTGTWGIATIPPVIEFAVCKAVSGDIRRNVAFYTGGFTNENDGGNGPAIFLTADVRAALQPYRKFGY